LACKSGLSKVSFGSIYYVALEERKIPNLREFSTATLCVGAT